MDGTVRMFARRGALSGAVFEINKTPPEEKARRAREREAAEAAQLFVLSLTPFSTIPKVSFENVKIGASAVRKLLVQNPSSKSVKVQITSFPKTEFGFEIDFDNFTLGPHEETKLHIGWVPQKSGNVREKIVFKYGSNKAPVVLLGSPVEPKLPSRAGKRFPLQPANTQKTGKDKGSEKKPDVHLPDNPVKRKIDSNGPLTTPMSRVMIPQQADVESKNTLSVPVTNTVESWSPQKLVDPEESKSKFIITEEQTQEVAIRRETYVKSSTTCSFISSTPASKRDEFVDPLGLIPKSADISLISQNAPVPNSCKSLKFQFPEPVIEENYQQTLQREVHSTNMKSHDPQGELKKNFDASEKLDDPKFSTSFDVDELVDQFLDVDNSITPLVPRSFKRVQRSSPSETNVASPTLVNGSEKSSDPDETTVLTMEEVSVMVKEALNRNQGENESARNENDKEEKSNSFVDVDNEILQDISLEIAAQCNESPKISNNHSDLNLSDHATSENASKETEIKTPDEIFAPVEDEMASSIFTDIFPAKVPEISDDTENHVKVINDGKCSETQENAGNDSSDRPESRGTFVVESSPLQSKIQELIDVTACPEEEFLGTSIREQTNTLANDELDDSKETYVLGPRSPCPLSTIAETDEDGTKSIEAVSFEKHEKNKLIKPGNDRSSFKENIPPAPSSCGKESNKNIETNSYLNVRQPFSTIITISPPRANKQIPGSRKISAFDSSSHLKVDVPQISYNDKKYYKSQSERQNDSQKENIATKDEEELLNSREETREKSSSHETYIVEGLSPERVKDVTLEANSRTTGGETFTIKMMQPKNDVAASTKKSSISTGPKRSMSSEQKFKKPVKSQTFVSKETKIASKPKPPPASVLNRKPKPVQRLTLIKPIKSASVVRHPNPFAAKNMYYDERWIQKQENGFTKWLNFILTPRTFDDEDEGLPLVPGKVDVAKLWKACSSEAKIPRAPTREVLSLRAYSIRKELNKLRRNACTLWQTPAVTSVIRRVEIEIEKKGIMIRNDKGINKDVGMKKKFLELLLSYNPLWLNIGFETIYGEIIPVNGAADIVGLSHFIINRLLSDPDIQSMYAHPTVPHHYGPGYEEALKQFTLKKFLQLVFFLDQAKSHRLIKHDPCLFCKDSKIKCSQDVLLAFSRDFLAGEGNLVKHLAYMGYEVSQKQSKLDEYDFAVTNLAIDLKDGVRLCRLMELLQNSNICSKLRMPATSRLQKIYNVELALKALGQSSAGTPKDIESKNIVDGHMEKTLGLMWHIIFGFQLDLILEEDRLYKEIQHLKKSLEFRARVGDAEAKRGFAFILECQQRSVKEKLPLDTDSEEWLESSKIKLLLQWSRLVCAHYGIEIENLSVSFSDGRALCFLLHHYYPTFLKREEIAMSTSISQQQTDIPEENSGSHDDSLDAMTFSYGRDQSKYQEFLINEKKNFKTFHQKTNELGGVPLLIKSSDMSNTIPDSKVTTTFLAYLAGRLLDLSVEMKAARTIQLVWRKYLATKREKELKEFSEAASKIQKHVRRFLKRKQIQRYQRATIFIQRCYQRYKKRRALQQLIDIRIAQRKYFWAALVIQKTWRAHQCRQAYLSDLSKIKLLQCIWRYRLISRRRKEAATCIQSMWRMIVKVRWLENLKKSTVVIQTNWRRILSVQKAEKLRHQKRLERERVHNEAATIIQKYWKRYSVQRRYRKTKSLVVLLQDQWRFNRCLKQRKYKAIQIQSFYRMYRQREEFRLKKKSAILIQSHFRRILATQISGELRRERERQQRAATRIQSGWRMFICKNKYLKVLKARNDAATKIQAFWKMQRQRYNFQRIKRAVIVLQSYCRRKMAKRVFQELKLQRKLYLNKCSVVVQSFWRGYQCRKAFALQKRASTFVQNRWRFLVYLNTRKQSALIIQAQYRMKREQRKYFLYRKSVIIAQSCFKRLQAKKMLENLRKERDLKVRSQAAVTIQTNWRRIVAQRKLAELKQEWRVQNYSATIIQKNVKMFLNRKTFLKQKRSVTFLASVWRFKTLTKLRHESAIKLQSLWRMYMQKEIFISKRLSAVRIQCFWRKIQAQRKFKEMKELRRAQIHAATVIQSHWKKFCQRKRYITILLERKEAAIRIQTQWRMLSDRRNYQRQIRSIVKMQSHFRTILARKELLRLKKERDHRIRSHACVVIQARFRGFSVRQKYNSFRNVVITLQNIWRYKLEKRLRCSSVVAIQSFWRMFLARSDFMRKRQGAVTIQSFYRRHLAMKELDRLRMEHEEKRQRSAAIIQKHVRVIFAKKVLESLKKIHYMEMNAATIIQRDWRRFATRKKYLQLKNASKFVQDMWRYKKLKQNRYFSALKIQSWIRMALARKQFKESRQACISLQCWWRQRLAVKTLHILKEARIEEEMARFKAALTIQSYWRMAVIRKQYQCMLLLRSKSAVIIQSSIRMYFERKRYLRMRKAALVVQQCWRAWKARENIRNAIRDRNLAAVVIQKHWRRYEAIRSFTSLLKLRMESSIRIQSWIRKVLAQNRYHKTLKSIVLIQRQTRILNARKLLKRLIKEKREKERNWAAVTIQKTWRGYVILNEYTNIRNALRTIQIRWRFQRELQRRKAAADMIRAWYLKSKEQRAFRQILKSALVVQKHWRRVLAQKELIRLRERKRRLQRLAMIDLCVIEVQAWWRMIRVRREFLRRRTAAIVIQSRFRGYRVRKAFSAICEESSNRVLERISIKMTGDFGEKITDVRQRLREAQENVVEENKLCSRTTFALEFLFNAKDMGYLIKVVRDLDVSTRFSSLCCDRLVEHGSACILILVDLISKCNRSVPHMEIISAVFDVFINLSKYQPSRETIASDECREITLATLIELMFRYREKSAEIFSKGCAILWALAHCDSVYKDLNVGPLATKISSLSTFVKHRHQKENEVRKRKSSFSMSFRTPRKGQLGDVPKSQMLSINPPWQLSSKITRHFPDPYKAVTTLMKKLDVGSSTYTSSLKA